MITKPLALPAFVAIYAAFGIGLLITSPSRTPDSFDGKIQWNPFTEEMTIRVDSNRAIINLDEYDVENTRIVRSNPDSQILIRVTGGNPTRLKGKLPDGVLLVNPAGVYVGPDSGFDVGQQQTFDTLNSEISETDDFISNLFSPTVESEGIIDFTDEEVSTVELKGQGNTDTLAINKSGVVRAAGPNQKKGRAFLTAEPKESKD